MTRTTDWNSLVIPTRHDISEEDFDVWGSILNDMFEDGADELLIRRGDLAARPSAGGSADASRPRMYLATDQSPPTLSVDIGGSWVDVGGGDTDAETLDGYDSSEFGVLAEDETVTGSWSFDQTISGDISGDAITLDGTNSSAFAELAADETVTGAWGFDQTISGDIDGEAPRASKTFGGNVNGSHSDFASAQAAIDFADTNGYGVVSFPPGSYGAITIPTAMTVRGPGVGGSSTSNAHFDVASGNAIDMSTNTSVVGVAVSSGDTNAIGAESADGCRVSRVRFVEAGANGLRTDGSHNVIRQTISSSNISGASVSFMADSSENIAIENTTFDSFDGGTDNIVSNNT